VKNILNMKPLLGLLFCLIFLCPFRPEAQNAPVTTAGNVLSPGPIITIPIRVTNFVDIGAISLTLDYNQSIVHITGITPNINLPGFTADWTTVPGRIVMGWFGTSGVTLPDNALLLSINFGGLTSGSSALNWFDNGSACEYAKYDNGSYTVLTDDPTSVFYVNGSVTFQRPAPITILPVCTAILDQTTCIPVIVNQFTNIGSISLTLNYDPAVLTFLGFTTSTITGSWSFNVMASAPGKLVAGGFGPGFSLPDGSILFNACFTYHGGTSLLSWYDANGFECEYADGTTLVPLYDLPQTDYYINGLVTAPLIADFMASNTAPPNSSTVTFTDLTAGGPTSWQWSFDRPTVTFMNGTDANSQNPQVQFTDGGLYTVTLVVFNSYLSDLETKTGYIRSGIPGLWTGDGSTEWFTDINWDDHLVPDQLINVVIPAGRPAWPHWKLSDGADLIIGTHCKTITIQPAAHMTVDGNVVLNE
jgi:PKD repeat protein